MRAMIPDGQASVRMGEVSDRAAAPDQAVVEVEAYSVNRGETFLLEAPRDGWRPGKDVAGIVLAAAADGSGPPAGARVVAHAAEAGWAERVTIATSAIAALPKEITATTAAALPLAGLTALRLVRRAGSLAGRRLLITGASGGVGHFVVELAVQAGAEVTAVSGTPQRGARLRDFGANVITDVRDADGWFDVAMESVGGTSFAAARRSVRPGGLVIWFGQASRERITLDFFEWIDGTVGAPIAPFDYTRSDRSDADDLAALVRLVHEQRLHPEIAMVGSWDQTPQTIEAIRARQVRGNAVLVVSP